MSPINSSVRVLLLRRARRQRRHDALQYVAAVRQCADDQFDAFNGRRRPIGEWQELKPPSTSHKLSSHIQVFSCASASHSRIACSGSSALIASPSRTIAVSSSHLPRMGWGVQAAPRSPRLVSVRHTEPIRPSAIAIRWRCSPPPAAAIRSIAAKIIAARGTAAAAASDPPLLAAGQTVEKSGQTLRGEGAGAFCCRSQISLRTKPASNPKSSSSRYARIISITASPPIAANASRYCFAQLWAASDRSSMSFAPPRAIRSPRP